MPYRRTPIIPDQIYHVFNRSIAKQPIFSTTKDYQRFLNLIDYYQFQKPPLRFSHFNRLPLLLRSLFETNLQRNGVKQVEIFAYCIMPNHVHFLLKESLSKGITTFMKKIQESYAKYYNTKRKRTGSLFQSMFKAVRIETDEQLLHVTRYIHLNPYSSYVIKSLGELTTYPWSSYREYLSKPTIVNPKIVLDHFKSIKKMQKFTIDQADYQKSLSNIGHLIQE